jgi:hypothetical protein
MKTKKEIIQDLKKLANDNHYDCDGGTINEQVRASYFNDNVIDTPESGNPIKPNQINLVFTPKIVKVGKLLRLTIRISSGCYKVTFAESEAMDIPAYPSLNTKFDQLKPDKPDYSDAEYGEMLNTVEGWLQEYQE